MSSPDAKPDSAEICDRIDAGTIDSALLWTLGQALGRFVSGPPVVAPWVHSAEADPDHGLDLNADAVEMLHAALTTLVAEHPEHPEAQLAVWAIGKMARPTDEPLFAQAVRRGLEGDDHLLYQALIALDNLDALPGVTSFSAHAIGVNREIGRKYLATVHSTGNVDTSGNVDTRVNE